MKSGKCIFRIVVIHVMHVKAACDCGDIASELQMSRPSLAARGEVPQNADWPFGGWRRGTVKCARSSGRPGLLPLVLKGGAEAGLGVTILPEGVCADALRSGKLVRIMPQWSGGTLSTTMLLATRRGQLPSVRAVADFLIERFAAPRTN